jgi:hypothetical protein
MRPGEVFGRAPYRCGRLRRSPGSLSLTLHRVSWQRVIVLELDGELYGLDLDETRAVVHWLRTPNSDVPAADPGSTAAAVFYERLLEEPKAQNPPMNDEESRGILLALARMVVEEGLTERQSALHEALLAHFAG